MNSKKTIKLIAAMTVAAMCLSGCTGERKREISRSPKPMDYTVETPEIKNMVKMPEKNKMTHDYTLVSANLSKADLSGEYEKLMLSTFDTKTVFPKDLPGAFNPKKILEDGKKEVLSCGVRGAHEMGYTGKGVGVVVIDGPILTEHEDYKNSLKYYHEENRISKSETAKMHGTAICSILVGKNGVAPDADLYYFADDSEAFGKDNAVCAEDIYKIIELNKTLPKHRKIRVISMSIGADSPYNSGYQKFIDALKAAEAEGIFIISPTISNRRADLKDNKLQYMGLGKIQGKTGLQSYKYADWLQQPSGKYKQRVTDYYKNQLCLPMDDMTLASPTGNSDYVYYCLNGISWSTPYLAGAYALACQADPDITFEKFYDIAIKTADSITNSDSLNTYKLPYVINVKKILEYIKNEKKNK